MFLTLKASKKGPRARGGPKMEQVALNNAGPGSGRTGRGQYGASRRPSCLECRTKKLRCTGGGESCARCETQGIPCVFPPTASRKRARHESPPPRAAAGAESPGDSDDVPGLHHPFPGDTATIPVSTTTDAISHLSNTVDGPGFASWEAVPDFTDPELQVSNNHLDWTAFPPLGVTNTIPDTIPYSSTDQPESISSISSISSETNSQEHNAPPLPPPPPSKSCCTCIPDTLRIVQSLDDDEFRLKTLCFDEVLKLQKWIIFHCLQPLTCEPCSASSSAHTVVLVICERLTEMFTCLSRRLSHTQIDAKSVITITIPPSPPADEEEEQHPEAHAPNVLVSSSSSSPASLLDGTAPTPRLYDAESGQACTRVVCNAAMFSPEFREQYSAEEQYHMGRVLARLQMRNFGQLLVKMGDAARRQGEGRGRANGAARMGKIRAMEARMREASERMEGAFGRILECLVDRAANPGPAS